MKRLIIFLFGALLFLPSFSRAQVWDWVIDEQSMNAFTQQYLNPINGQIGKLGQYLLLTQAIQRQQDSIAMKVRFIHMVRDSLFKSLQQVEGVQNSFDEQLVHKIYGQIYPYFNEIQSVTSRYDGFKDTWTQYEHHVKNRTDDILKMTAMAVRGGDEKNLLDKEQRLALLNHALFEARKLLNLSKQTLYNLQLAEVSITILGEKANETANEVYRRANEKINE